MEPLSILDYPSSKQKRILSNMIKAHGKERVFQSVKFTNTRTQKVTYHENVYWLSKWLTGSTSYFQERLWDLMGGKNIDTRERFSKLGLIKLLFKVEKVPNQEYERHRDEPKGSPLALTEQLWEDTFQSKFEYVGSLYCKRCLLNFKRKSDFHIHLKRFHHFTDEDLCQLENKPTTCLQCGKSLTTKQRLNNHQCCSVSCAALYFRKQAKETCLERYGVENSQQAPSVRDKVTATCLQRFGTTTPAENKEVQLKMQTTCLERYGVESFMETDEFRIQKLQYQKSHKQQMNENRLKSCLSSYGYANPMQVPSFKEKHKETLRRKYGKSFVFELHWVYPKIEQTCKKRYGVPCILSLPKNQVKSQKQRNILYRKRLQRKFLTRTYSDWINYKRQVYALSRQVFNLYFEIIFNNSPRETQALWNSGVRLGTKRGTLQVDHIYSVKQGFQNKVPIEVLSNPFNLQLLTREDNLRKWGTSGCSLEALYQGFSLFREIRN